MDSRTGEPRHFPSNSKKAEGSVCLDDCQSISNWLTLMFLVITSNIGIAHRFVLRSCNRTLKKRSIFLKERSTIFVVWGGVLLLGFALREHSTLVLGLLACLALLQAATHALISKCSSLTTKALTAKYASSSWIPWLPLSESAPTVVLPLSSPPPRGTA